MRVECRFLHFQAISTWTVGFPASKCEQQTIRYIKWPGKNNDVMRPLPNGVGMALEDITQTFKMGIFPR